MEVQLDSVIDIGKASAAHRHPATHLQDDWQHTVTHIKPTHRDIERDSERKWGGGKKLFTRVAIVVQHPLARLGVLEALQLQRAQRLVADHVVVQVDGRVMLFQQRVAGREQVSP